jgi:integrase
MFLSMLKLIHGSVAKSTFQARFTAFLALKSGATAKAYTRVLRDVTRALGPPEGITEADAMAYAAGRRGEVADRSLLDEMTWLSAVWSKSAPHRANPWAAVLASMPRKCKEIRPTMPVPFDEVRRYFEVPPLGAEKLTYMSIIGCGFFCALRRREIQQLNFESVKYTESKVMYLELPHTKSGATERVPVPGPLQKLLESLRLQRASEKAVGGDALFVSRFFESKRLDRRMSYETIGRIFQREIGYAPHRARCTAICKLRAEGVDVDDVRRFARLASAQMVLLYDRREIALEKIVTPRYF